MLTPLSFIALSVIIYEFEQSFQRVHTRTRACTHAHTQTHYLIMYTIPLTTTAVSRPLHPTGQSSEVKSTSKPISSRSRATAARLVLMQAKMHAKPAGNGAASLADEDRLVIRLCASAGLNPTSTETMPFFVGKVWPNVLLMYCSGLCLKLPGILMHLC